MTCVLYAGFDLAKLGAITVVINQTTDKTATVAASATYCHRDIQAATGTGTYDDLATALAAALTTATVSAPQVAWSTTNLAYTISSDAAFTITSGTTTLARNVLGTGSTFPITATFSALTSRWSADLSATNVRPYYVIRTAMGARSLPSDDYEPDEIADDAEADDGDSFGQARTGAPVYNDFTIEFETKAATFKRAASAAVPWTFQHFYEHARNVEPFLVDDDVEDTVHKLRAEAARFKPLRVSPADDTAWHMEFRTRMLGRL